MHISEGILNKDIILISSGLALLACIYSYKNFKSEESVKSSILSAIFFFSSFIHIPFGIFSIHLILNGIVGAMLGLSCFVPISIALIFQALLFGFGGFSVLGINILIMSSGALFAYFIFNIFKNKKSILRRFGFFLVGFSSILVSSSLLALSIGLSNKNLFEIAISIFSINFSLSIIEGIISLFLLEFLKKAKLL